MELLTAAPLTKKQEVSPEQYKEAYYGLLFRHLQNKPVCIKSSSKKKLTNESRDPGEWKENNYDLNYFPGYL